VRAARLTAREVVGELPPGSRVVGVTKGQFSLLDLVEAVLEQTGPASVLVSTWTPGKAEMERVLDLLSEGGVETFRLLVDRSFPGRHPGYVARVTEICGASSIRMTRTHAKFALIGTATRRICIRTSMNFNTNPRLEQFDLDDNAQIYDLFERVVADFFTTVPAGLDVEPEHVERAFSRWGKK
jgi:hypothetical protein